MFGSNSKNMLIVVCSTWCLDRQGEVKDHARGSGNCVTCQINQVVWWSVSNGVMASVSNGVIGLCL